MKERPILFSTPMVQAILEGRKTMTRRVIKLQPGHGEYYDELAPGEYAYISSGGISGPYKCPYGNPGDILWVKETFSLFKSSFNTQIQYEDGTTDTLRLRVEDWEKFRIWKRKEGRHSSLFMFKSMSRIRLLIKSILVERLQDISAEDIKAEGIYYTIDYYASLLQQWQDLWIKINGPESWEANPWVWVIKFEKL